MHGKGSLSHHSSEQQAQIVLTWRTSLLGYELLPAHSRVSWGIHLSKCFSRWVHQLLWGAAQDGMAGGYGL